MPKLHTLCKLYSIKESKTINSLNLTLALQVVEKRHQKKIKECENVCTSFYCKYKAIKVDFRKLKYLQLAIIEEN